MKVIGIISDTHGDLPDAALEVFRGNYREDQVVERVVVDGQSMLGCAASDSAESDMNCFAALEASFAADGGFAVDDADAGQADETFAPTPVARIVHAGDIGAQWILDMLSDLAPLTAVLGNCDYPEYYVGSSKVGTWEAFQECGVRGAVLHKPVDLQVAINGAGPTAPAYIKPAPRLRIHGHTHEAKLAHVGDGILVCPGSVSRPSGRALDPSSWFKTVALVRVEDGGQLLSAEIVRI